jgi:hypothetical protein
MKTVSLLIGNTDNRLSQKEWYNFVNDVKWAILCNYKSLFFLGGPPTYEEWQNVAFVFSITEDRIPLLKEKITEIRKKFNQDSAAWVEGDTQFI